MILKRKFHEKIDDLQNEVFNMAEAARNMIDKSIEAFLDNDRDLADKAIKLDDRVDEYNYMIESRAVELLAMQQPMAVDLRRIAGIMKIISDLERLGDYSVDVAKAVKDLSKKPSDKVSETISNMRDTIFGMLDACMLPLKGEGEESLEEIVAKDDHVDKWYDEICEHVVNRLLEHQSESHGRHEMTVQLAARHLERMADHITNVCERVHYIITGEMVELHRDD